MHSRQAPCPDWQGRIENVVEDLPGRPHYYVQFELQSSVRISEGDVVENNWPQGRTASSTIRNHMLLFLQELASQMELTEINRGKRYQN
jgi:hypothetical protein